MVAEKKVLLKVSNLKKYFPVKAGIFQKTIAYVKAVDDIDLYINEGETMGLVGESGCGKTTIGETILRLNKNAMGKILFKGEDLLLLNKKELREMRKGMQMIFQDPYSSLNPRMTVAEIVGEPLDIHNLTKNKKEKEEKVKGLLNDVGITLTQMNRYPYEFSGGQRQRIGVARALAVKPQLIVADEPVSALDVSIQAQIINMLKDLQNKYNLAYLFISHDLSVVKHISDRVAVMYLGKIVEQANKKELFSKPLHPYTQSLLSAIPVPDPKYKKNMVILNGDVPNSINPPSGCYFHPRCPKVMNICRKARPELKDYGNKHSIACHLLDRAKV
ncbi:MAG TPA: oligopeptide/dipeptide ABC transporter ATP-binding protein [Atribacterota bacterium]|nr:oligopeptide/dipeptide ABC transporter ATP-binding protein [Atribacterota bacterium]